MLENIFINVFNMSLTAAYCAGIVLCIRRLPKLYSYALWLVVFLRLAVPFSLESVYSLVRINSSAVPTNIGLEQTPQIRTGLGQLDSTANRFIAMAAPQTEVAASVNPLQIVIGAAAWVWLIVAAGLLCYGAVSYGLLKYRIKDAKQVEGKVYVTKQIQTPFVMGLLKPRIYLPQGLSGRERAYVISHEQVHLKRHDYLVKQLAFAIVCFHWFNPMAWVSLMMMCRDMELSCDEQVLRASGLDGERRILYKKEYAAALLSMASGRQIRLSGPLFFGNGNVKGRIQNVLSFRRRGRIVTCVSVLLLIAAAAGLMGNRKPTPSDSEYISVTSWWYDAASNDVKSQETIVKKEEQEFQELAALLEKYYYKVTFHSLSAQNDYLYGAGRSIVLKGDSGDGFCVRDNGSAAICKAGGSLYEYGLKDGMSAFHEIEELLAKYDTAYGADDIEAFLASAGYTHACRIPEEYWAGIEGLSDGEKAYPILLATDGVYDNRDGNTAAVYAALYCLTEDGMKEIGEVSSGGTAYPLSYDKEGIYLNGNHNGNRCVIDTKTWELTVAEGVEVVYGSDGDEAYYATSNGEVRDSDMEEFEAFWGKHADTVVMNFEELSYILFVY